MESNVSISFGVSSRVSSGRCGGANLEMDGWFCIKFILHRCNYFHILVQ